MDYVDYKSEFIKAATAEPNNVTAEKYWKWAGCSGVDWCAIFVSYVADQAGILGKLIYNSPGAGTIPKLSVSNGWGTWYNIGKSDNIVGAADLNFVPQPGDLILFNPYFTDESGNGAYYDPMDIGKDGFFSSHIGIVIEVDEKAGTYTTKEGNTYNSSGSYGSHGYVNTRTRTIGDWGNRVNGFYRPNWVEREWISSDKWLGDGSDPFKPTDEQVNNAIMVARYFISNDWTLEAICGMLGNMTYESSINPGVINYIGASGLVQWLYFDEEVKPWIKETFSKSDTWVGDGSDYYNGEYQCARIKYEADEGLMWGDYGYGGVSIPLEACGIFSLKQFSQSKGRSAYDLARYFLFHYERPESVSTSVQKQRGDAATVWYDFLSTCNEIHTSSLPTITSVEQPNAKQVIIKGTTGGQNTTTQSVKLYYKWEGVNINPDNKNTYDDCIMFKPQHEFEIKLVKPRIVGSILIVIVQEGEDDESNTSTFKYSLTPSYPCLHIKDSSGNFVQYVPHVRNNDKLDLYVPIIRLEDGCYAIYNTDIEKISD